MIRAVLDTNILISAFLVKHGKPAQIIQYGRARKFQLIVAEVILAELREVLDYQHIQKRFHPVPAEIEEFVERLSSVSTIVTITEIESVVTSDPDDDLIVACAVEGQADYLVSGNKHLLDLQEYRQIQFVTPSRFLTILDDLPDSEV
jgi:putative PIN family toxin of toxin-antitoxin system